ncbi:MAG: hypothetical protein JWM04_2353 [Verrucomicrobiales bacterium]|nr:hypothetical protein [Verrucomicrobiales bacterium]
MRVSRDLNLLRLVMLRTSGMISLSSRTESISVNRQPGDANGSMSQSRDKAEKIVEGAITLETDEERSNYLDRACTDPELRKEVEALLQIRLTKDNTPTQKTIKIELGEISNFKSSDPYLGQTLDEKYCLDRLLGRGGMGAVYLATHRGTGRYVAVKLITPQYMQNEEFVERFKREARAAGRLRHPNIVDVTDFGFAQVGSERVAYLVMEYLDGCSLRDVLAEEKRLPLYWVVDILEQVCNAVHEAHKHGIIHRDLKPDNIWLEPNRLGGYRAKVLDFGIAKMAEAASSPVEPGFSSSPKNDNATILVTPLTDTAADLIAKQKADPAGAGNFVGADQKRSKETQAERPKERTSSEVESVITPTTQLTRVGAIIGTPTFMSPEQCRGEETLDARSDIYSLGVIAYQMLAGTPPFTGEPLSVIQAHKECAPEPVKVHNHKVPKKISLVLQSALEKDPAKRPKSAAAFANSLRANADGLGVLYRRAFALYNEYFPKILQLSLLAHLPMIAAVLVIIGVRMAELRLSDHGRVSLEIGLGLLKGFASFVTASTIGGVTAIIVAQLAVAPMRQVELESAFAILKRRWKPFLKTGMLASARIFLGSIMLVIPGIFLSMRFALWAPVVLMEGLETKAALARSRALGERSRRTILVAMVIQFAIPTLAEKTLKIIMGLNNEAIENVQTKVLSELATLISVLIMPLLSMVPALLYLKMRQLGGETLSEVVAQTETETTRTQWEKRMRTRLTGTSNYS